MAKHFKVAPGPHNTSHFGRDFTVSIQPYFSGEQIENLISTTTGETAGQFHLMDDKTGAKILLDFENFTDQGQYRTIPVGSPIVENRDQPLALGPKCDSPLLEKDDRSPVQQPMPLQLSSLQQPMPLQLSPLQLLENDGARALELEVDRAESGQRQQLEFAFDDLSERLAGFQLPLRELRRQAEQQQLLLHSKEVDIRNLRSERNVLQQLFASEQQKALGLENQLRFASDEINVLQVNLKDSAAMLDDNALSIMHLQNEVRALEVARDFPTTTTTTTYPPSSSYQYPPSMVYSSPYNQAMVC